MNYKGGSHPMAHTNNNEVNEWRANILTKSEQQNQKQQEHYQLIMSHLQQYEEGSSQQHSKQQQGDARSGRRRAGGGSRQRMKSPLEQQWEKAIELQAQILEREYPREMMKAQPAAHHPVHSNHKPRVQKSIKHAQREAASKNLSSSDNSLLLQGILKHRDVYAQQQAKNQMRKQQAAVEASRNPDLQSDLDISKQSDSYQERAKFKKLMQQKHILTNQQVTKKQSAMKKYLQNNDGRKEHHGGVPSRGHKNLDKSLLEIAKDTSTSLQLGAKAASLGSSDHQPRQSLTLSEQEKILKVNNVNAIRPGQADPIIEELEAEKQIEEVVAKVNRLSPKINTQALQLQPSVDNEPPSAKSIHSQNSQRSIKSGKSRASINSKKSQKSMRSNKGDASKSNNKTLGDANHRKGLKQRTSEEAEQNQIGQPPSRKKVNAVILDFTMANGPIVKKSRKKSNESFGIPANNQHLQAKTMASVQKQHDDLLNTNFANSIDAFFASDIKTFSQVQMQPQMQQHPHAYQAHHLNQQVYQPQPFAPPPSQTAVKVPAYSVGQAIDHSDPSTGHSHTVKTQKVSSNNEFRAAGSSIQRRQHTGQVAQKSKPAGVGRKPYGYQASGVQRQEQGRSSRARGRQAAPRINSRSIEPLQRSPRDQLVDNMEDSGSALRNQRSRSGHGRNQLNQGINYTTTYIQNPAARPAANVQVFSQYLNEAPLPQQPVALNQMNQTPQQQDRMILPDTILSNDLSNKSNMQNFNQFQRQFLAKQSSYQGDVSQTPQIKPSKQQRSRSTQNRVTSARRSRSSSIQSLVGVDKRLGAQRQPNHRMNQGPVVQYGGSMLMQEPETTSQSLRRSQSRGRISGIRLKAANEYQNASIVQPQSSNESHVNPQDLMNQQQKAPFYKSIYPNLQHSEPQPYPQRQIHNQMPKIYLGNMAAPGGIAGAPEAISGVQPQHHQSQNPNIPSPLLSGLASFHQQQLKHQAGNFNAYTASQQKTMQDLDSRRAYNVRRRDQPGRQISSRQAHSVERGMQMKQMQALQAVEEAQIEEKMLSSPQLEGQYIMKQPRRDSARSGDNTRRNKFEESGRGRGGSQSKSRFNAIYNLKDNIMSGISGLGLFSQSSSNPGGVNISRAFKDPKEYTDEDKQILETLKTVLQCKCERDPQFQFACKHGVSWFAANVILAKIKRKLKVAKNANDTKAQGHLIKVTIMEEFQKCDNHFKSLKGLDPEPESATQIERDLGRTFPMNPYFKAGNPGYESLKNVLRAFACYDKQVDYVQGMNFIVGQLLMHCQETMAFWLFVELIEECELRDIFQNGLPGLFKHTYIIRYLIMKHLPDLHEHFEHYQVRPELYASDLIFSVFTMVLPETQTHVTAAFFNLFFTYKWEFFYKLILTVLKHIREQILACEDELSTFEQIKIAMSNKNDPFNYAHSGGVQDGKVVPAARTKRLDVLVEIDSDLESVAGSVSKIRSGQDAKNKDKNDENQIEDKKADDENAPKEEDKPEDKQENDDKKDQKDEQEKSNKDDDKNNKEAEEQDKKEDKKDEQSKSKSKVQENEKEKQQKQSIIQDVTPGGPTPGGPTPGGSGFFGGVRNIFFGFGQSKNNMTPGGDTPGGPDEERLHWAEFPWEKYLIKQDIIKQWKQVDMKYINHLHANFDTETAKFVNVELEEVSIIHSYSQVEGLVNQ